ncbi:prisilkin-39-like isoform X1 [Helicoverpa zea]|uniref:prisilkin-39-like isoform X1 n=2 Tax=Helicoverpa zea TaxID=7113 RepID=UPI001F56914B|nr:prisilkin-39-like isoform X1 [Helicoverpa zea]
MRIPSGLAGASFRILLCSAVWDYNTSPERIEMALRVVLLLAAVVLFEDTCAAPANEASGSAKSDAESQILNDDKDDLKTAASSGYAADRYSDWSRYPSAQGVTGYGSIDSRYNYGAYGGYDSPYGYNGYDSEYPRYGGYSGNSGYGGYAGNVGYGSYGATSGYGGYKGGYGGYGGYAGNGGLNSYYGYSNPSYQGANHLGYGYYRRPGYGSIYNSGITPSLVTGYRGYSK